MIMALFTFCIANHEAKAQSMVTEIQWTIQSDTYTGLLVLYPNNQGSFIVKFNIGFTTVSVIQDAVLNNQYDFLGNCTSYINCYNPRSMTFGYSSETYAPDNFVIYPNGNMFTQDAAGAWSTSIRAIVIPPYAWNNKFIEYNYRP